MLTLRAAHGSLSPLRFDSVLKRLPSLKFGSCGTMTLQGVSLGFATEVLDDETAEQGDCEAKDGALPSRVINMAAGIAGDRGFRARRWLGGGRRGI